MKHTILSNNSLLIFFFTILSINQLFAIDCEIDFDALKINELPHSYDLYKEGVNSNLRFLQLLKERKRFSDYLEVFPYFLEHLNEFRKFKTNKVLVKLIDTGPYKIWGAPDGPHVNSRLMFFSKLKIDFELLAQKYQKYCPDSYCSCLSFNFKEGVRDLIVADYISSGNFERAHFFRCDVREIILKNLLAIKYHFNEITRGLIKFSFKAK